MKRSKPSKVLSRQLGHILLTRAIRVGFDCLGETVDSGKGGLGIDLDGEAGIETFEIGHNSCESARCGGFFGEEVFRSEGVLLADASLTSAFGQIEGDFIRDGLGEGLERDSWAGSLSEHTLEVEKVFFVDGSFGSVLLRRLLVGFFLVDCAFDSGFLFDGFDEVPAEGGVVAVKDVILDCILASCIGTTGQFVKFLVRFGNGEIDFESHRGVFLLFHTGFVLVLFGQETA